MGASGSPSDTSLKDLKVLARARTRYNDIFVIQDGQRREMWFNGEGKFFLQSRIDLRDPLAPALVYSRMTLAALLFHPRPRRALVIGLGGGALSNSLHAWYPDLGIDVAEIDPKVIAFAKKYFFVREEGGYRIHAEDGRRFVQGQARQGRVYDLIFLDAFKSGSIPYHLKTLEFYRELRSVLGESGVVVSNLYGKSNTLKPRDRETFLKVFPQIYLFEDPDRVATVSIATRQESRWDRDTFRQRAEQFVPPPGMTLSMREVVETLQEENRWAEGGGVFRDDFDPRQFQQAVDRHNLQKPGPRPYPITNVS